MLLYGIVGMNQKYSRRQLLIWTQNPKFHEKSGSSFGSATCGMKSRRILQSLYTRVVPKVMSNFVLHANWEQQTKENAVVDGTSCCVILECLVISIACIT